MLLLFITITACTVWVAVEGKIKDSIFLSKCTCTKEGGKPDCDFSKLSKKKLLLLVEKLSSTQIICVSADKFLLPTFSSSLVTLLPGSGSFVTEPSSSPTSGEATTKKTTKNDANILPDGSMAAVPRLPPGISACAYDGYMATVRGVQFAFPTTVITTNIVRDAASRAHNEAIRDLMLELEEEDDGCKFNLHGGYRSKDGFLDRKEPALQWLKTQIHSHVRQLLSFTNSTDLTYDVSSYLICGVDCRLMFLIVCCYFSFVLLLGSVCFLLDCGVGSSSTSGTWSINSWYGANCIVSNATCVIQ